MSQIRQINKREADLAGIFRNASLTHLGSIEVIRLDAQEQPAELAFVPLDKLRGAIFARPALFRFALLSFDDGSPDEIVLVPLLYGISWLTPNDFDQDGTMTRFISSIEVGKNQQPLSIGVGHQDFVVAGETNQSLFGLGSVGELMMARSMAEPNSDEK